MTTERDEALLQRLRYQLDSRTFNTQLHLDLIERLVRAQPHGEPVGLVCGSDDKGGFFGQLNPAFKMPPEKFHVYTSPPAQAIPEGWVLVPKKMTPEMDEAFRLKVMHGRATCWAAVLAAAPKPPETISQKMAKAGFKRIERGTEDE